MKLKSNQFMQSALIALDDIQLQTAIDRATGNANKGRIAAMEELDAPHDLRHQGRNAKLRALHDLPEMLEKVETNVKAAGGHVLWAVDGEEACQHVLGICRKHGINTGVKSKSMVTEEIDLVPYLEAHHVRMIETDLGEYIVQVSGDHPSHIVMPVMHMTKERVRDVLMEHADMPYAETPEEMAMFARQALRQEYLNANIGITGGNFLIAETGHIVTITNEGNLRLATSIPNIHVAVVGIEKVVPTWEDALTLIQLLTRHGTGQRMAVYVNAVRGPAQDKDDGARHFYLILLDNNRSKIYASDYAEALACIRCGSCLNACPVYNNVGGHAYGSVYPGPIGAVITPLLNGKENAVPLPFASSLCGACRSACPVDINIPDMLLGLRHDLEEKQEATWRVGMKAFSFGMQHPLLYQAGKFTRKTLETLVEMNEQDEEIIAELPYPFNGWTDTRDFPAFAEERFRDWWKKNRKR